MQKHSLKSASSTPRQQGQTASLQKGDATEGGMADQHASSAPQSPSSRQEPMSDRWAAHAAVVCAVQLADFCRMASMQGACKIHRIALQHSTTASTRSAGPAGK